MVTRDLNRVEIIGNLTRDPELKTLPSGGNLCTFAIATNRKWKRGEIEDEETTIHKVVAWSKLAEICSTILHKGSKVYAEGRLATSTWEDDNKEKQTRVEVVLENIIVLSPKDE